ncbi:multidrug efflux outer membrane protein OprN [Litchfieldella qijiaojingensis]|uniref:Multidrug efflux outer membrane protein OprN n=1 Tax=Litchfieldella qijiaojingensis TaxID=980347 RepID=A0ABQ2YLF6_9GAMM|nr:efflux transporter outer membrane subunit [Halomonas qijiaojingensis]GGX87708.1 multidrug efflux outer membrane protein OprN [Halomonas qijiaojingensis]
MRKLLPIALSLLLTACAVGPDYQSPELPEPQSLVRADTSLYATEPVEAEFWQRFDDPLLTQLVEETLATNHDLRIALARYDRSRALLRESRQNLTPDITAEAGVANQRLSADQMPGVSRAERDADSFDAGILAFWELDVFGRVRRSVEAQRAESEATAADLRAVQVVVVAELVDSYFQLRGLQEQLRVARANADNQRESLELVDARLAAGRGIEFDSVRARAQLETTLSRIPALEGEIAALTHRIAVLSGKEPGALVAVLEAPAPLPALPDRVATGLPGELLRRRPDIAAAERRLEVASARIGVATADLYPRFTLGGLLGTQAANTDDLFSRDSETRLIALGIDWSFLDIGRVRARMAAADADAEANLARYEQAILLALEETETALARYAQARREREHLQDAAEASAEAARQARQRFEVGVVDFLEVIDAERSRLEIEDSLARSHTRTATALVGLYKALAGGWEEMPVGTAEISARL